MSMTFRIDTDIPAIKEINIPLKRQQLIKWVETVKPRKQTCTNCSFVKYEVLTVKSQTGIERKPGHWLICAKNNHKIWLVGKYDGRIPEWCGGHSDN